jgi:HD-like signal output (HDOD) protein
LSVGKICTGIPFCNIATPFLVTAKILHLANTAVFSMGSKTCVYDRRDAYARLSLKLFVNIVIVNMATQPNTYY